MKKLSLIVGMLLLLASSAHAQITVPNTFVTGGRILASEVNANFDALESDSLNRTGGTITGNITMGSGVTIDGIDIGAVLGGTGTPTFSTVTATTFTGNLVGNVTGNLTGQVSTASQTSITSIANLATVGTITSGTWSGSFGAVSGTNLTGLAKLASANTFTAKNNFLTFTEVKTTLTPAASLTIDLSLGTHFTVSNTTTVTTLTISNPATSGLAGSFTLAITGNGTSHPWTWPASVLWPGGTAPTLTVTNNKTDFLTFITYDGGTTWYGFVAGQNF